ncbi:MAG: DNA (cytosine-5-)-methyltransferase [Cyanobacteriota bacterium]
MKVLDICSGIGGFTLGHMISGGFETVAFCEINEYCQQVLSLRFPSIPIIPDIHDITTESISRLGVGAIDGIIGGPPCQPFSTSGRQLASKDDRNLWPEVTRIIRCLQPQWICLENVPNLLTVESGDYFRQILWEFSQMGFDVQWGMLSAASVGAVHFRERIWITAIANSQGSRWRSPRRGIPQEKTNSTLVSSCNASNPTSTGLEGEQRKGLCRTWGKSEFTNSTERRAIAQPAASGSHDGLPCRLDRCLLTHSKLTDWLAAATVPSFTRFSAEEVGSLAAEDQAEYKQLLKEYQAIRRQHREEITAIGNAIVPQCAAKIFDRLKFILGC